MLATDFDVRCRPINTETITSESRLLSETMICIQLRLGLTDEHMMPLLNPSSLSLSRDSIHAWLLGWDPEEKRGGGKCRQK